MTTKTFLLNGSAIVLILLLTMTTQAAESDTTWLDLRKMHGDQLEALADPESEVTKTRRIAALLNLTDRAINQSAPEALAYLDKAQLLIEPESEAEEFARLLNCQLTHRSGLPTAAEACDSFAVPGYQAKSRFNQAYLHATLSYLFYRQGKHTQSIEQANATLPIAESLDDHSLLATAHNHVGLHFSTRLLPRMALPHFEAAWDHADRLVYPEPKQLVQLNLAANYTYLGRPREALRLLKELSNRKVTELYPSRRVVVQAITTHAQAVVGEAAAGETALLKVLQEDSEKISAGALSYAYTSLGIAQLRQDRPLDALRNFDKVQSAVGLNFQNGLDHPRIQAVVVPYAKALTRSGELEQAVNLLQSVVAAIPQDQPDQLLLDALAGLAFAYTLQGNDQAARDAREKCALIEQQLWDASFRYQLARLNNAMEADRREEERARSLLRETELRESAQREAALKRQSWVIAAMLIALILLFQSRRLQKRVAATERSANERLEDLVKKRTRALEDEMAERLRVEVEQRELMNKLSETDKMRVLGQLTAGVAHDFNNLMTVITLATEYLQLEAETNTPDQETQAEMLRSIMAAADSGTRITEGLLAYARKRPLQPEHIKLEKFLTDSMPLIKNTVGSSCTVTIDLDQCTVRADQGSLTTAILNLLLNAKEAMPDGGTIGITLRNSGTHASIAIRDEGIGMSSDTQKRAFEPFFTTKTAGAGTGLGLSMVYGFAQQSGGDLSIDSTTDRGSVVTLTLPMHSEPIVIEAEVSAPAGRPSESIRALLVEDREPLLLMLERTLQQLDIEVTIAKSSDEALAKVRSAGMPDLLISDIVMPGSMDGLKLAQALRSQNEQLAIVLISGYNDSYTGDYVFLHKPFSVSELEESVTEALNTVSQEVLLEH